ncbi:MAG TPA: superoxide dismutase family protein [Gammaproteobacteria bacterium]
MKKATAILLSVLPAAAILGGCAMNGFENEDDRMFGERKPAEFINSDGDAVGSAVLTQTPNGVLVDVELRDLKPGWHGFHVHEKGNCMPPDFKAAGGHFNPDGNEHGVLMQGGPHAGDMPNIFVDADGTARFQVITTDLSFGSGGNTVTDTDGAALMVHSDPDDYRSQPSGDAGSRIACAEIN